MIEWKSDPSPLHLLVDGESAFIGKWKLHIDKMKEIKTDGLFGSLLSDLSEKEKRVLRTRFDLDGNPIEEESESSFAQKYEKRKARLNSHPYQWRVDYHGDGDPEPFSSMGGSARTAEEGKALAVAAVEYANLAYNALKGKGS